MSWVVERDKVVRCRLVVSRYEVGQYRWRWVAMAVAWWTAYGYWACYVREVR